MRFDGPDDIAARMAYTGNRLDRLSEKRGDAAWVANLLGRADTRFVLFAGDRPVISIEGCGKLKASHPRVIADRFEVDPTSFVLLGFEGEPLPDQRPFGPTPWFAAQIPATEEAVEAAGTFKLIDLRSLAQQGALPAAELGALAQGRALHNWHQTHPFCSRCGTRSVMASAGYKRDCPSCSAEHFPRTDPVAIMLTVHGDRCLLGRQRRFLPGMYSCLAGFIEPGETIEDAVRRETREESGILVGRVDYRASQPWPFPASLMIGCVAEALTTEITRDDDELEDCRWFDKDEVRRMFAGDHPDGLMPPNRIAIAHHLLRGFIAD